MPLREELPSLGVELIYKARGVGAKSSKHAAHQAAKNYRYSESFKDLQKRRFFPKSSSRIRGILEERRRREAEIKNGSSAVSYESYQNELYGGDWVTDSSSASSSSKSKSATSSQISGVHDIPTTGNRRMTKTALKRWKLFRIKSKKKKSFKKNHKKSTEKTKSERSVGSLSSLIGEEVFTDFLAPVPKMEDGEEETESSLEDIFPSWYPEKLKQKIRNSTPELSSRYASTENQLVPTDEPKLESSTSPKSGIHSYYDDEDFLPVGWNDEQRQTSPTVKSPPYYGRPAPSFLDSDHYEEYPEAKSPAVVSKPFGPFPDAFSPPPDFMQSKISKTFRLNGTPTTMATSPGLDSSSSESSSVVSSITGSVKRTETEHVQSDKPTTHLPSPKQPQVASYARRLENTEDSVSDSSLIGLNVAFPKDEQDVTATNTTAVGTTATVPQNVFLSNENDVDISNPVAPIKTTALKKDVDETLEEQSKEEQSGIFDTVFNFFNGNTVEKRVESPELTSDPAKATSTTSINPFENESTRSISTRNSPESPLKFFNDIPEQLYKAFGADDKPKEDKAANQDDSQTSHGCDSTKYEEIIAGTLVVPGQNASGSSGSYHPIVPGVDITELDDKRPNIPEASFLPTTNSSGTPTFENKSGTTNCFNAKEDVKKRGKPLKWWKGSFPKFRAFLQKKRITTRDGSVGSLSGEPVVQYSSSETKTEHGSVAEKKASRRQRASIEGYEDGQKRFPIIKVNVDSKDDSSHRVSRSDEMEDNNRPKFDANTALAFSQIPDAFYTSLEQDSTKKDKAPTPRVERGQSSFHHIIRESQMKLTQYETDIGEISKAINEDLTIAYLKDPDDGQMLLHRFSSSPFPSHVDSDNFLDQLLYDIRIFKEKLDLIYVLFPAASEVIDADGDLPVHLLARNLMEWETTWYAKMYNQASKETINGSSGGPATRAITTLYHTMSLCIETLLKRVVLREDLCRQRGSMGALLPLHIATIFTSSVSILRQALEVYPVGALESASIKGFHSFVPDGALPLEIHETFCTDFPKWEVEVASSDGSKWSKNRREERSTSLENTFRRSDLLFAYNTSVARFWKDKGRIQRIESRIKFEAQISAEKANHDITTAAKRLWIWLCTFAESKQEPAMFSESVRRIIDDLPMSLVRFLATIPTPNGEAVLDVAHPDCVAVIRNRLDVLAEKITPIVSPSGSSKTSSSKILNSWDEIQLAKSTWTVQLNIGQLCRSVFRINENKIPTSFVILPYRLELKKDGTLGISTKDSTVVAVKFADSLLKLTDPRSVLYFLEKKSEAYFGVSMYEGAGNTSARQNAFQRIKEFETKLLELYETRNAYLYLIDETTGAPIVTGDQDVYPLVLNKPQNMVKKLLPMMIPGMIQMRGEKAVSVLSTVLLDESISVVPAHYEDSAKRLKLFIQTASSALDYEIEDAQYLQTELDRFLAESSFKKKRQQETVTSTTEWNVELSILRMLFEYNDPTRSFAGLKRGDSNDGIVQWTFDDHCTMHNNDASSQTSVGFATTGAGPLKFHQPHDDESEGTQETPNLQRFVDVDLGLSPALSEETTESQRISTRSQMLTENFAVKIPSCSVLKSIPEPPIWNPAEQVWVDARNRLDVTSYFWDETHVTSLRVSLIEQANKLCLLQRRIRGIRQEENMCTRRAHELFCRIMGDDINILDVPSLRSLFAIRRLLGRLNELENKILENEVDAQHFGVGVKILNQEVTDLVSLSGDSDSSSDEWSGNSDSSQIFPVSETAIVHRSTQSPYANLSQTLMTEDALAASRNSERIRRAFATARRRNAMRSNNQLSIEASQSLSETHTHADTLTSSAENDATKVSSLTTRSSNLRQHAAAARSRAMIAAQQAEYPSEIALPALNHMALGQDSSGSLLSKGVTSEPSSSSQSFENTSIVQYDKKTGLIEF